MACCLCCCGGETCTEGQQGKCCCGGTSGACCAADEYCCSGVCQSSPCSGPSCGGITVSGTSIAEGSSVTFTVSGMTAPSSSQEYPSGVTFRFRWLGTASSSDWTSSNALSSYSVSPGQTNSYSMTLNFTLDCDGLEGSETIALQVYVNPYNNTSNTEQIVCTSPTVTITDGTPQTGVTFTTTTTSVTEGNSYTFHLAGGACVTSGSASLVAYGGTGFSSADASVSSSWTMSGGTASVTVNVASDAVHDPNEKFRIKLTYTAAGQSYTVYSQAITIVDTNTPTYSITANQTQVTEGDNATFTVSTTNLANNTQLSWSVGYGGGASSADLSSTSGTVTINNNSGTITIQAAYDQLTESGETFNVKLYSGSTLVATSASVTILDPGGGGSCSGTCLWEFVEPGNAPGYWEYQSGGCSDCGTSSGCCCDSPVVSGSETSGDTTSTACENPLP